MGGSSGSGGASGTVDFPSYMKTAHADWLNKNGSDLVSYSVTAAMSNALSLNPFTALSPYDPSVPINVMDAALSDLEYLIDHMNHLNDYTAILPQAASLIDSYVNPAGHIAAAVVAHSNMLDTEYNSKIIPAFEAGMRDINMVQSSAFVLGRAQLLLDRLDRINKFAADLEMQTEAKRVDLIQTAVTEMLRLLMQKIEYTRAWASMTIDFNRIKIAANADKLTEQKVIEVGEHKWPLEVWQYGANLLAAISGGTSSPARVEGNQVARIVGGALSGASAGALIGSNVSDDGSFGGAIGAVLGAGLGAAMSA